MGSAEHVGADGVVGSVFEAVLAELVRSKGVDISDERVAARAGVDVHEIRQRWPNSRELLSAALDDYFHRWLPTPDTGSLRADLRVFACWLAELYNTPNGRRVLDAFVARPSDWEVGDARQALLDVRDRRFAAMFHRAVERGECTLDEDPGRLLDILAISVAVPLMFHDRPVTREDAYFVVDVVLDGVAAARHCGN